MKFILTSVILFGLARTQAQELFVYTEPASNMAAKSFGFRLNNYVTDDLHSSRTEYMLNPEIMWGASKHIMIHAEGYLSNRSQKFLLEGGGIYAKYRFYSVDEVHSHFRMAAFGRYSFNNSYIHEYAINLNGHNTGYEGGIVATKLINKIALSVSGSYLHAQDNGKEKFLYGNKSRNAVNYTFSFGKLMLPKEYTSFKQTNINLMLEMLGQTNLNKGYSYLDIAPSVQFIFLSRMRIDVGYRRPLITKLHRTAPEGFLLRLEYNIFNAY